MKMPVRLSKDGIFYTLQGEGPLVGTPSLFIRLDNCNLKCKWGNTICDAHYTSWNPSGSTVDIDDLLEDIADFANEYPVKHFVITGGEPALQPEAIRHITGAVRTWMGHTTIETNGTRFVDNHGLDLICLSPKLSNSIPVGTEFEKVHTRNRYKPLEFRKWMDSAEYFFKIVIDQPADIEEALELLEEVGQQLEPKHVLFMPQGIDTVTLWERSRWLANECKRLGVRFTPRIQVDLWGNTPGT